MVLAVNFRKFLKNRQRHNQKKRTIEMPSILPGLGKYVRLDLGEKLHIEKLHREKLYREAV